MRRVTGVLGATTLVGALVAGSASAASTAGSADSDGSADRAGAGPWIPFHQEDVTYPAGERCEFEVFGEVLHDREFFRNVTTYADGSPRTQLFKGPLIMRFTNMETGEFVDRNASGRAFLQYGPGEAFESITIQHGHFVGGMPPGSDPAQGIMYVTGEWSSMVVNDDGTHQLFLGPKGSAENLCDTLAP